MSVQQGAPSISIVRDARHGELINLKEFPKFFLGLRLAFSGRESATSHSEASAPSVLVRGDECGRTGSRYLSGPAILE
jgi:hypothetical protein